MFLVSTCAFSQTVNFTVAVGDSLKPISPYIYGTNQTLLGGENWGAMRIGGNRLTGYNWENNASNAGSDYKQESDDYMTSVFGIPSDSANIPGIVTEAFYKQSKQFNAYPLVTLQMAGFVAKDKNGPVDSTQAAPSSRWAYAKFVKGSPLSLVPDTSDDSVFMDEYVNFLMHKYGNASSTTGIKGYELDNEPDLWNGTHPRLHPLKPTCQELIQRSVPLAEAVKNIDSAAEIFGPVSYGFEGYRNFQDATDWNVVSSGKSYKWFLDYYLDQLKKASDAAGRRLLDVLDLHWYSEAQGDDRITDPTAATKNDQLARVQAPRTLWDPHYREKSWIIQYDSTYMPLLPNVIASINKYYPGTKLAFTEFSYGGENDISGAIAMSDVLGIFAKYGVYLAAFWELNQPSSYISAAYKIYRNYDGNNSAFGSLYVPSETNDSVDCSIYGSLNESGDEMDLIVIDKNFNESITGNFSISSRKYIVSGRVWEINRYGSSIHELDSVDNISDNSFSYPIKAGSICHIVLKLSDVPTIVEARSNGVSEKYSLNAYPNPFNPTCRIQYSIPENSIAKIEIYSVTGALIKSYDHISHSGYLYWDGTNGNHERVASGVYFAVLRTAGQLFASEKLLLLK